MFNEVEKKVCMISIFHFNAIVLRDEESLQLLSYAKQCFLQEELSKIHLASSFL